MELDGVLKQERADLLREFRARQRWSRLVAEGARLESV
jgi:hypothetical protein